MTVKAFRPGLRFSTLDAVVLMAATAFCLLPSVDPVVRAIVAFVVAHFFLFCNVFRIARTSELLWAAVFVFLCGMTISTGAPSLSATFGVCGALTCILVGWEMHKPSYHGVWWERINPRLPEWWESQQSSSP